MSYHDRIKSLEVALRSLNEEVNKTLDKNTIQMYNERKLEINNELRRLNRLQWEEDHERVHFDDDH